MTAKKLVSGVEDRMGVFSCRDEEGPAVMWWAAAYPSFVGSVNVSVVLYELEWI